MKIKRYCILVFSVILSSSLSAQIDSVVSGVYKWNDLKVEKRDNFEKRQILEGSTTDNENLNIYSLTIGRDKSLKEKNDEETLIVIKEGKVKISFENETKILGPGSIALIMPNDDYEIENSGDSSATYYLFFYKSKYPADIRRGIDAGGSFLIDWNDLVFQPHDKGGVRQFFNRPTSMFERFDMHVTTLNPEIKSHEPHTHIAAEIVLMINGNSEMQISDSLYQGSEGDLFFLGSNVSHAIKNIGTKSCMYFAIQWE
jgi:(S)-ureidoglycine aminohydrolase